MPLLGVNNVGLANCWAVSYITHSFMTPIGIYSVSRVFAYCRVSTSEQTTDNQILALSQRGFEIPEGRVVSETISGGVVALERPAFKTLVNHKLEAGDTLVVLKLDRLGRDTIDVLSTVALLTERGIHVKALDLGDTDLSSPAGKLHLTILAAVAEMERGRIRERTHEGLERAKAAGKKLGRPKATETTKLVQKAKAKGLSQSKVAEALSLGISTVKRHWNI